MLLAQVDFRLADGDSSQNGYNGYGSFNNYRNDYGTGGGYYTLGTGVQTIPIYFNQGGMWVGSTNGDSKNYYRDYSGSGGNAGSGGEIYYNNLNKIHAYNGDRITNEDYDTIIYEYEVDGTKTDKVAEVLEKRNGSKFVQTKIFAQEGIIRATYSTNHKMTEEECAFWNVPYVDDPTGSEARNVKITEETTTSITGYGQGIGSGAGNLEKSNGIFKSITELSN